MANEHTGCDSFLIEHCHLINFTLPLLQLPSYPPLHERIIGHRITAKKMTGASCQDGSTYRDRPSTYKGWDDLAMQEALTAVNRGMSVRRAALTHNVPKSTLSDRVTGKVIHGIKSGPQPYLSLSEEEELVSFLLGCAAIGYPRTRKDVIALVQDILISKGKSGVVTDGWWTGFKNRHCEITLRSAVPLSLARAKATDPAVIEKYYDLLENTLCENSLLDKPSQIFNCDETGIPLSPKSHRVIDHIGSKNPSYVTSDSKEQVTVLACVSASGYCMPPFVLFARRKLNPDLVRHEVPGTLYGMSSKGWIDLELFSEWFARHFLVHAPSARPLLLLMDGHSSHFCPDMIARAAAEKVILFTLPPNTTHLTQPLDKSGFSPLKSKWKEACHKFLIRKKGRTITIYDFSELFVEAWEDSMNMKTITSGFEVTGIYPFNRSAITQSEKYKMFNPSSLAVKSGLAYIPFYSPHPVRLKSSVTTQDSPVSSSTPLRSTFCHDSLIQSSHSLNRSYSSPALNSSNEAEADCLILSAHCLSKFLTLPSPNKVKSRDPKLSGRVLTSSENLAQMKELQMKKEREKREKEERKLLREQKAQQKRHEKEVMRLRKLHKRTGSNSSGKRNKDLLNANIYMLYVSSAVLRGGVISLQETL